MCTIKPNYDITIIGSGHNGLVAACYLAKAGLSVLVLERNAEIGGSDAVDAGLRRGGCKALRLFLSRQSLPGKDRLRPRPRSAAEIAADGVVDALTREREDARVVDPQRRFQWQP